MRATLKYENSKSRRTPRLRLIIFPHLRIHWSYGLARCRVRCAARWPACPCKSKALLCEVHAWRPQPVHVMEPLASAHPPNSVPSHSSSPGRREGGRRPMKWVPRQHFPPRADGFRSGRPSCGGDGPQEGGTLTRTPHRTPASLPWSFECCCWSGSLRIWALFSPNFVCRLFSKWM